jgi:hypothetical protein
MRSQGSGHDLNHVHEQSLSCTHFCFRSSRIRQVPCRKHGDPVAFSHEMGQLDIQRRKVTTKDLQVGHQSSATRRHFGVVPNVVLVNMLGSTVKPRAQLAKRLARQRLKPQGEASKAAGEPPPQAGNASLTCQAVTLELQATDHSNRIFDPSRAGVLSAASAVPRLHSRHVGRDTHNRMETRMKVISRDHRAASIAMLFLGFAYVVLYPRALLTDEVGWVWDAQGRNYAQEHMFMAIYGCMGLFLMFGARDPIRFMPFIDFVIVSGAIHGGVMWYDALNIPGEEEHLLLSGDVVGTLWGPVLLMLTHPVRFYLWPKQSGGVSPASHGGAHAD